MMSEIRHLENRHDVIFFAETGPIWIKFRRLVQNDMLTAMMWSKSKPDVEFQYDGRLDEFNGMSSQSHLPYCRVQSPGEINVMIVPHCRYKNSVRHIENRFSPYFIFFWFLMQFRLWRAAAFVSSPIHLLSARFYGMDTCRYLTVLFVVDADVSWWNGCTGAWCMLPLATAVVLGQCHVELDGYADIASPPPSRIAPCGSVMVKSIRLMPIFSRGCVIDSVRGGRNPPRE